MRLRKYIKESDKEYDDKVMKQIGKYAGGYLCKTCMKKDRTKKKFKTIGRAFTHVAKKHMVNELFKNLPKIENDKTWFWGKQGGRIKIGDDTEINIKYTELADDIWRTDFSMWERGSASTTEVFLGAMKHIQQWVKKHDPNGVYIIPAEKRREKIYKKLIDRFVDKSKYEVESEYIPFAKVTGWLVKKK